jgi:hypothetical protein
MWEAKNLYSITSGNPITRSNAEDILLKRVYQDRDLAKLTEKDLREWFTIKIMGPNNLRTQLPKAQVREFAVYMVSGDEWLCHDSGNRLMTSDQADKLIDSIYDEELLKMRVVSTHPPRKSLATRVREAKEELNEMMDGVQDIILGNDEKSIEFMQSLSQALKTLKDTNAN